MLFRSINAPPLRGILPDGGAAVADAYLDGRPADDAVDIPAKFPGFSRDQSRAHMHPPPGGCTEILATRDLHLARQFDDHGVVGTIRRVPNDYPIRGSHWVRIEATVRPEFFRHGDNNTIACAVTLFEGQGDTKLYRLIGGEA